MPTARSGDRPGSASPATSTTSIRTCGPPPRTRAADGALRVGGMAVADVVADHNTPAYLLDETDFRARARAFRDAFAGWEVFYAGKAFLCTAVAGWIAEEGLSLDVCSEGELAVALRAGFDPARIGYHGNNKTVDASCGTPCAVGVGRIIVDSFVEIERLAMIAREARGASHAPPRRSSTGGALDRVG